MLLVKKQQQTNRKLHRRPSHTTISLPELTILNTFLVCPFRKFLLLRRNIDYPLKYSPPGDNTERDVLHLAFVN